MDEEASKNRNGKGVEKREQATRGKKACGILTPLSLRAKCGNLINKSGNLLNKKGKTPL
jgi:hypothetical protein